MIKDKIEIKYPIEKLGSDKFDANQRIEESRQVTIEYVLRSGEKELPSVFLGEIRVANQMGHDNNPLASVDLVANEVLSFDTCFRLFLELRKTEFWITPEVTLIGENHKTISDFIKNAEETIGAKNYFYEEKLNHKQLDNNSILENFIVRHAKFWTSEGIGDRDESLMLNDMELDEDDRMKLTILSKRLGNYSKNSVSNKKEHLTIFTNRWRLLLIKIFIINDACSERFIELLQGVLEIQNFLLVLC